MGPHHSNNNLTAREPVWRNYKILHPQCLSTYLNKMLQSCERIRRLSIYFMGCVIENAIFISESISLLLKRITLISCTFPYLKLKIFPDSEEETQLENIYNSNFLPLFVKIKITTPPVWRMRLPVLPQLARRKNKYINQSTVRK